MVQGHSFCSNSKRSDLFKYNLHSKSLKYHKHIYTHNGKITKSNEIFIRFLLCKNKNKMFFFLHFYAQQRFAVDLEGKVIETGNLSFIVGLRNILWELEYQFVLSCRSILQGNIAEGNCERFSLVFEKVWFGSTYHKIHRVV